MMEQMVDRQSDFIVSEKKRADEVLSVFVEDNKKQATEIEILESEIERLKTIRVDLESQVKKLTLDCEIWERNVEHLTLIVARDRERVSAELAQYAAAASGVPVKSVTTNVLSSVTPQ